MLMPTVVSPTCCCVVCNATTVVGSMLFRAHRNRVLCVMESLRMDGVQDIEKRFGGKVRVVLLYGRSNIIPHLVTHHSAGLAIDCMFLHAKPEPGVNQPQEVYLALEELVDGMAVRGGHHAYIHEASGSNLKKILNLMVSGRNNAGNTAHQWTSQMSIVRF